MPRLARLDAPGALHHIMIRGIERRNIFKDNKDRDNLIGRLALLLPETQTSCYAWVLMPNHATVYKKISENKINWHKVRAFEQLSKLSFPLLRIAQFAYHKIKKLL